MLAGSLLHRLPLILTAVAFVSSVLGLLQWFLWERASEIVSLNLRNDLASGYLALDPAQRRTDESRSQEAELSASITTDVKLLREYLVHFYGGLPREGAKVLAFAVMLLLLSPKLTAIFALGIFPAIGLGGRIGRVLRRRAAKALADYSQLTEWLQQRLLGIETIKHYRTEKIETKKMSELTTALYERFLRAARVKARTGPTLEGLAIACMAVVLCIALKDIGEGKTTGSVQLSFFTTLALLSQAADKLGRYLNSNREGAAAVDRLRSLLGFLTGHRREAPANAVFGRGPKNQVSCRNVTAVYPGSNEPALKDFSFDFVAGQIHCLAGPSGAGKSTAFNLLLGLLTPQAGTVEMTCASDVSGAPVCYVPQKVLLLPATIAENVAYPDATFDEARVMEALAKVELTATVAGQRGGIHERVGEGGVGVSGGQAQRILLARLWYQQKPFILVDEGTSALDPEVERTIYQLLRELASRGAVVVTIAHRSAAAESADVLLLLDQGRLVKAGSPKEVMASPEFRQALQ